MVFLSGKSLTPPDRAGINSGVSYRGEIRVGRMDFVKA
jgi:hypothetical protein